MSRKNSEGHFPQQRVKEFSICTENMQKHFHSREAATFHSNELNEEKGRKFLWIIGNIWAAHRTNRWYLPDNYYYYDYSKLFRVQSEMYTRFIRIVGMHVHRSLRRVHPLIQQFYLHIKYIWQWFSKKIADGKAWRWFLNLYKNLIKTNIRFVSFDGTSCWIIIGVGKEKIWC